MLLGICLICNMYVFLALPIDHIGQRRAAFACNMNQSYTLDEVHNTLLALSPVILPLNVSFFGKKHAEP